MISSAEWQNLIGPLHYLYSKYFVLKLDNYNHSNLLDWIMFNIYIHKKSSEHISILYSYLVIFLEQINVIFLEFRKSDLFEFYTVELLLAMNI